MKTKNIEETARAALYNNIPETLEKLNRNKKRNNYTLSAEAQAIVDKVPAYKKSGFVSEAIVKNRPACKDPKIVGIYFLDTPEKIEFANNLFKKA